jgi:hypothetical protein
MSIEDFKKEAKRASIVIESEKYYHNKVFMIYPQHKTKKVFVSELSDHANMKIFPMILVNEIDANQDQIKIEDKRNYDIIIDTEFRTSLHCHAPGHIYGFIGGVYCVTNINKKIKMKLQCYGSSKKTHRICYYSVPQMKEIMDYKNYVFFVNYDDGFTFGHHNHYAHHLADVDQFIGKPLDILPTNRYLSFETEDESTTGPVMTKTGVLTSFSKYGEVPIGWLQKLDTDLYEYSTYMQHEDFYISVEGNTIIGGRQVWRGSRGGCDIFSVTLACYVKDKQIHVKCIEIVIDKLKHNYYYDLPTSLGDIDEKINKHISEDGSLEPTFEYFHSLIEDIED